MTTLSLPMPRNVVFVAPFPIETTMRFARAAAKLDDVRLLGIVHTPPEAGSADARVFHDVIRVTDPLSGPGRPRRRRGAEAPARSAASHHRHPRAADGADGAGARALRRAGHVRRRPPSSSATRRRMKDALRAAGLPVARHQLVTSRRGRAGLRRRGGLPDGAEAAGGHGREGDVPREPPRRRSSVRSTACA